MAEDKSSEASSSLTLSSALQWDIPKDSSNVTGDNQELGCSKTKHRRNKASISTSSSAHDLRCLEVENEKKDASSPRGVLETCLTGRIFPNCPEKSPSSSSSGDASGEEETEAGCSNSRALSNWRKFFKLWKRRSIKRLASFPPIGGSMIAKRKGSASASPAGLAFHDIYSFQSSLQNFSLSDLEIATDNFSPENIVGRGGHAEVYQGCLPEGRLIAVKRLTNNSTDERTADFLSELGILAHVNHPNTAKLIGCCIDGGMFLVSRLSPLGSLGSVLHGPAKGKLDWRRRYKIATGTAEGLTYLHESCQRRIIHRDIKADNILLTEDFEAQICDFGLAKWLPKQWTHHNISRFEGTFGYFAPEYFMHGIVDEKTDVFAFGVLLLELVTGRPALDNSQQSLVFWAKPLLEKKEIKELVDPSLGENYNGKELHWLALTAASCIDQSALRRPRMSQVVKLLRGGEFGGATCRSESRRRTTTLQRTFSEEVLDVQEYNSTRYLQDVDRLREIALGS